MKEAERAFETLCQQALSDPSVVGLYLSGSRGKGFENPYSDYDIRIVFANSSDIAKASSSYKAFEQHEAIEIGYDTLAALRTYAEFGSEFAWDRYSFVRVKALIDKTGELQPILDAKGKLPEDKRLPYLRDELDAFINAVYRSLKCHRAGNELGAKLEASAGIPSLLNVMFGLEGRHAPFLGYLQKELETYPLEAFPLSGDTLIMLISDVADSASVSAQQKLMQTVEPLCKNEGMTDVFEAWEEAYPWLLTYEG